MASFRQRNNKWQARIKWDGYPDQVKTFGARSDAERWARSVESEIDKGQFVDVSEAQRTTLGDLIARYLLEVTPTMKGSVEDTIKLKACTQQIKVTPLTWPILTSISRNLATICSGFNRTPFGIT